MALPTPTLMHFILGAVVLVYASLTLDAHRKCQDGKRPTASESSILNFVNMVVLIASICVVLYSGYHLFRPKSSGLQVSQMF